MKNIGRLLADLIKDGFSVVGVLAPLLSISIPVSKALNVPLAALESISYAWAFLPLLIWVLIAYVRRWFSNRSRDLTLNDEVSFAFKPVHFHVEQRNDPAFAKSGIRVAFIFQNFSSRALRYKFETILLNGHSQSDLSGLEDVVPPNGQAHFWTSFEILENWAVGQNREIPFTWKIRYGAATGLISRELARIMRIEIIDSGNVTILGDKEQEIALNF